MLTNRLERTFFSISNFSHTQLNCEMHIYMTSEYNFDSTVHTAVKSLFPCSLIYVYCRVKSSNTGGRERFLRKEMINAQGNVFFPFVINYTKY